MPFDLTAKIGLDQSALVAGMEQVKSKLQSAKGSVSAVGSQIQGLTGAIGTLFTIGAITHALERVVEYGSMINDLSARTQIGTSALQAFNYAATQTGAQIGDVAAGIKHLASSQVEAAGGNKELLQHFHALGIELKDIQTLTPEEVFRKIAAAMEKTGASADKIAAAVKTMGKSADVLLPSMLEGFGKLTADFDRFNLTIAPQTIEFLDSLGDKADVAGYGFKKLAADGTYAYAQIGHEVLALIKAMAIDVDTNMRSPKKGHYEKTIDAEADIIARDPDNETLQATLEQKLNTAQRRKAFRDALSKAESDQKTKTAEQDEKKETLRLDQEIGALKFAALSAEEKLIHLTKRRAELLAEIVEHGSNSLAGKRAEAQVLKDDAAILALRNKHFSQPDRQFDALARIGGLSQNPNRYGGERLLGKGIELLQKIEHNTSVGFSDGLN